MLHRHTLGVVPAKPHTALRENGTLLIEQMITRSGFSGPYSILYYRTPPTDETEVVDLALNGFCPVERAKDQPLQRRHIRTQNLEPGGDFLTGRRTLLVSDCLDVGVCKPTDSTSRFFSNGDGDELYFVKAGSGTLESVYGVLPFREHDYVLIPKMTPYRMTFDGPATLLVHEGRPEIGIPSPYRNEYGQLTDFAPYSHRDFRWPLELLALDPAQHGEPPYEIVMKRDNQLTLHRYEQFPLDIAGWDGAVYPVAFNIHDYQPKTGLVHLPPTIHTTFVGGDKFVICSFVPRMVDYHEQAIPCPYAHANVDMDELLYYVEGNFTSRKGIDSESLSVHPAGITHGPHPGTYEKSIGTKRTDELAVMIDAYSTFYLTTEAVRVEQKDYHTTWVK